MGKQTIIKKMSSIAENFEVFAICTNLNEFQFCGTLNQLFSVDLHGQAPKEMLLNGKTVLPMCFSAMIPNSNITITVIDNQNEGEPLLDFYGKITFFVKISPIVNEIQLVDFQEKFSQQKDFFFVQKINSSELTKQKLNLFNSLFKYL